MLPDNTNASQSSDPLGLLKRPSRVVCSEVIPTANNGVSAKCGGSDKGPPAAGVGAFCRSSGCFTSH